MGVSRDREEEVVARPVTPESEDEALLDLRDVPLSALLAAAETGDSVLAHVAARVIDATITAATDSVSAFESSI
jgi:FXSXX-COOH protein